MFFCFWKDPNFLVEELTNVFVDSAKLLMLKYVQTKISFCQKFENTIIRHVPLKPSWWMAPGSLTTLDQSSLSSVQNQSLGPQLVAGWWIAPAAFPCFCLSFLKRNWFFFGFWITCSNFFWAAGFSLFPNQRTENGSRFADLCFRLKLKQCDQ